jgi:hypothetical protein
MDDFYKVKILSIDAWRDEDGWYWNNLFTLEEDVIIGIDAFTPRKILKALREWDYLTDQSKGKLEVDIDHSVEDGLAVIINHNTKEPIMALSGIH